MTYLSKVWLNPLRTGAQRMLRSPHVLHAAVLGGISRQPVTERVLWRLEDAGSHRASVLVLTRSRPSWEHLVEQAGWPGAEEPQALVRSYEPLLGRLDRGRQFAFRLRANPVSSTKTPLKPSPSQRQRLDDAARPRGVRVPHRTASQQLDWLIDRLQQWGFAAVPGESGAPQLQVVSRQRLSFSKSGAGGPGRRVVLQTATFEGRLQVAGPEAARAALLDGVGPGKGYGCGLITLAAATATPEAD
jgi:CRISPR system Cascade subunit CasE